MHHDTAAGNDLQDEGRTQEQWFGHCCTSLIMATGQRCTLAGNLHDQIKAS